MEQTLSELFSKDPLKLTDQDLEQGIAYYRERYQSFVITGKAKEKKEVDLKDLGLL